VPCGEVAEVEAGVAALAVLAAGVVCAGSDGAFATVGVTLGGTDTVSATFEAPLVFTSWAGLSEVCLGLTGLTVSAVRGAASLAFSFTGSTSGRIASEAAATETARDWAACSAERGGASRSSSRAAGGVPEAFLISAPGFDLSDRRLILGVGASALAKLNSPAAAPDSG